MAISLKGLAYTFHTPKLLQAALTHPSALAPGCGIEFERLEFLGDRVLGLIIATWLFEEFPTDSEGDLSKRQMGLVCKDILVKVAHSINLEASIQMKQEKSSSQERRLETILADGCEALIGAVYMDGGIEVADQFVRSHWHPYLALSLAPPQDPKSLLQEWLQGRGKPPPLYEILKTEGPAHAPTFTVNVIVEGCEPIEGTGPSKQAAEKEAAQHMLDHLHTLSE